VFLELTAKRTAWMSRNESIFSFRKFGILSAWTLYCLVFSQAKYLNAFNIERIRKRIQISLIRKMLSQNWSVEMDKIATSNDVSISSLNTLCNGWWIYKYYQPQVPDEYRQWNRRKLMVKRFVYLFLSNFNSVLSMSCSSKILYSPT
jgi:hypothetical protein